MKQYYVYSYEPEKLNEIGEVYYSKINMSFVILATDKEIHEIRSIEGVYDARECRIGELSYVIEWNEHLVENNK